MIAVGQQLRCRVAIALKDPFLAKIDLTQVCSSPYLWRWSLYWLSMPFSLRPAPNISPALPSMGTSHVLQWHSGATALLRWLYAHWSLGQHRLHHVIIQSSPDMSATGHPYCPLTWMKTYISTCPTFLGFREVSSSLLPWDKLQCSTVSVNVFMACLERSAVPNSAKQCIYLFALK